MSEESVETFEKQFSDRSFWEKCASVFKAAGEVVMNPAMVLYYTWEKPETPVWAKATIASALGYFIVPVDAIPDVSPLIGFSDDLGVLTLAVASDAAQIDDGVKQKARSKLRDWGLD